MRTVRDSLLILLALPVAVLAADRPKFPSDPARAAPSSTPVRRPANAEPTMVVRAWRSMPTGREEMAVVFLPGAVELVTNSNFHLQRGTQAVLGRMKALNPERLRLAREIMRAAEERLANHAVAYAAMKGTDHESTAPSQTRYDISGYAVDPQSPYHREVEELLVRVWSLAEWQPIDTVLVELTPDLKVRQTIVRDSKAPTSPPSVTPVKDMKCRSLPGGLVCPVRGFGTAYLLRSDR